MKLKITLIPTPYNFQLLDIFLDENGRISPVDLLQVQLPDGIDWRKGIIINGRGPIWLYAHLVHLCHIAAWVATVDPREGAIVVQSHKTDSPNLGEIIPTEKFISYLQQHIISKQEKKNQQSNSKIIAFLGPPHSGKTVLMNELRVRLQHSLSPEKFQREFFIVRACPDGEGDWFAEIPEEQGKLFRYKNKFDDEFVVKICNEIDGLLKQKSLIFVDCGGKIDKKNQKILNHCTHAIIISSEQSLISEWRGCAETCEVTILAEIFSVNVERTMIITENPLYVEMGKLERNKKNPIEIPEMLLSLLTNL